MTETLQEKIIHNQICAYNGCRRPASVRLRFSLGFSARFCSTCAAELAVAKIGAVVEINDE
jgi:hypothetical protein